MASPVDAAAAQLRPSSSPLHPPLHTTDADEEDENVKQLKECAAVYLCLQDCLAETNRDWKSCQKRSWKFQRGRLPITAYLATISHISAAVCPICGH